MERYAELEIGLHRWSLDSYVVALRFSQPDASIDNQPAGQRPPLLRLDLQRLREFALDDEAYGRYLGQALFGAPGVASGYSAACAACQAQDLPPLHVRLAIGPSAPELHAVRWETLRDPTSGAPLFTDERLYWSRYLSSADWRPVRLRQRADMRALALIASPANLERYGLEPLDREKLEAEARNALGPIALTTLVKPGEATLDRLFDELREASRDGQPYDLLYLVAHGSLAEDEGWLWLEDEAGAIHRVCGSDLVGRLRQLEQLPRLVVLAACHGAGDGLATAGTTIGPRLAAAGVSTVLAMQGPVSIETLTRFVAIFLEELRAEGLVDRAAALARGAVREQPDWWMPVLFTRLKSGRIWYVPGFAGERAELARWPAIVNNINRQRCTPILGHGLIENLIGSRREIARRWAESNQFPMEQHESEDLPQVAQYLEIHQDYNYPRDELSRHVRRALLDRFGASLDADRVAGASLDELVSLVGAELRQRNPLEPHLVLARQAFPIYVTANPDNLLEDALRAEGKEPVAEVCSWSPNQDCPPSIFDDEPGYKPSAERPLVFHLFGKLDCPSSLVLTEDDYFDFLIGVTRGDQFGVTGGEQGEPGAHATALVRGQPLTRGFPLPVRRALADTMLLFLGFQVDDWAFRVLWRRILSQGGCQGLRRYAHLAVQIAPEEGRLREPIAARRYLEAYLCHDIGVTVFWGSADDFIRELVRRLERGGHEQ